LEPVRHHPDDRKHPRCLWLLRWTSKPRTANEKIGGGADTGHVWDKDLREYNNPLPKWWLWLFYITVAFGLLYLVFYPGSAISPASAAGPRQVSTSRKELPWKRALLRCWPRLPGCRSAELVNNEQAMSTAHNLFQQNCAQLPRLRRRRRPGLPEPARPPTGSGVATQTP